MNMLYNSDHFIVVQIDAPASDSAPEGAAPHGGYEIVDKLSRKGIYIEGAVAQSFRQGVEKLIESNPSQEALEDFFAGFTAWAQQPVALH